MPVRVALKHTTLYEYDRPVILSPQTVRLRPAAHSRTPISEYSLRVEPSDHTVHWFQDPHGNFIARFFFPHETRRFALEVNLVATLSPVNPFDFFLESYSAKYPFVYEQSDARDLHAYLQISPAGEPLDRFVRTVDRTSTGTIEFLVNLNRRVRNAVEYTRRLEPGIQEPDETLALTKGSCRDSSWLLIQILRRMGLAARFVSGYLIQIQPSVAETESGGPPEDVADLHAWAEVYLPGAGWIGLDPTSGLLAGEGHIPLAGTSDPQSAAPVSGRVTAAESRLTHEIQVSREPWETQTRRAPA